MAIKRTRQHKMAQAVKLQEAQHYSLAEVEQGSGSGGKVGVNHRAVGKGNTIGNQQFSDNNLFGYSLHLIRQDIIKTGAVALIVVTVLAVIVWLDIR